MTDTEFDSALIAAAFRIAGEDGWHKANAAAAARAAGLSLQEARARFPSRASILLRFGRLADQTALQDAPTEGSVRDKLFDLLMRRFDLFQAHRDGVRAILRSLPVDPPMALLLGCATRASMRWMLQAAGVEATGLKGAIQVRGLFGVWLLAVRAWEKDDSEDLSGTMAAVDSGLQRAENLAAWLNVRSAAPPPPPVNYGAGEVDPSDLPPDDEPFDTPPEPEPPPSTGPVISDPSV
nr:TetR family transcriptional regulator [uncultured Rhodopila sp.]